VTHRHSNLSAGKKQLMSAWAQFVSVKKAGNSDTKFTSIAGHSMHTKIQDFIKVARKEMGLDQFGFGIVDMEHDGGSDMDGRYLVWLCDLLFDG
jgi:hypothetical protein